MEIMKLLLEREDVNPDRCSKYGWTLVLRAAKYGRVGRLRLQLVEEDTNTCIPYTKYDRTLF